MAKLPDFVCLGVPRAGTTWLYAVLSPHPEVFIPEKELHFFIESNGVDLYKTKGLDWYLRCYENSPHNKVKGDIAAGYFRSEIARNRISETLPGRKMILMIRNPIARAWSDYRLRIANGSFKGTFEQLLAHEKFGPMVLNDGLYVQRIKEWQKELRDENILIVFLDDVVNEPHRVYSRICKYLRISNRYTPSNLRKKINQPKRVRSKILSGIHLKTVSFLSHNELWLIKKIIKKSLIPKIIYNINHARSRKEYMPKKEFNMLKEYYKPEIEELKKLFDRDLSHWYTNVETR